MDAKNNTKKKLNLSSLVKVGGYVLILLCIAGIIGFFAFYTNGFTDNFSSFYVQTQDGTKIMSSGRGYTLSSDDPLKLEVNYLLNNQPSEQKGFSVKIIPSEETDIKYTVDGVERKLSDLKDVTECFDIVYKDEGFAVNYRDIGAVLQSAHVDRTVAVNKGQIDTTKDMFTIIVYSYNKESQIKIGFKLGITDITGVTLDKEEIIFGNT